MKAQYPGRRRPLPAGGALCTGGALYRPGALCTGGRRGPARMAARAAFPEREPVRD